MANRRASVTRQEHTRREAGPQSQESRPRTVVRSSGCRRCPPSTRHSTPPGPRYVLVAGSEVFTMQAAIDNNGVLVAPERLIASTRVDFRNAAVAHVDRL